MPSGSDSDPPRFEDLRFEAAERSPLRPRRPALHTVGFLITTGGVAAAAAGGRTGVGGLDSQFGDVAALDWLFALSLAVAFWFGVVPVLRVPARRARYRRALFGSPTAAGSVVVLAGVFLLGTVGTRLLGEPTTQLDRALQPPALLSAPERVTGACLGAVEAGQCHGTLAHPLGTTGHGQDLVAMVASGAAVSVKVAFVVGALVVPVALAVGVTAGYLGGRTDALLMRYVDVQATVPAVLVYVVGVYVYGRSLLAFVLVFGLLSWGGIARQVRSEVRQLREADFVRAAREGGAGDGRILRGHVVPNVSGTVATAATQRIPEIVLFEAAISFLHLNDTTVRSWGYTITAGFQLPHPFLDVWWVSAVPVAALALTVLALVRVGDALRDATDPGADAGQN